MDGGQGGDQPTGPVRVRREGVVAMRRRRILVAMVAGALLFAGCGGDAGEPDASGSPATPSPSGSGDPGGSPGPPGPTWSPPGGNGDGGGGGEWTTGPLTVSHELQVPPVPQLVGIRSAAHPDEGYDRIVFDLAGELPGYTVRYVDEVREDPSDLPVTMPGRRYLLVSFTPAQAHTDAGQALISPKARTVDYPMMRGWVLVGDFEGYVSVAIGLDDVVGFRVGELPGDPGRIYLDVAA
jgi:hypothetical protein